MTFLFRPLVALLVATSVAGATPRDPMACAHALGNLHVKQGTSLWILDAFKELQRVQNSPEGRDLNDKRAQLSSLNTQIEEKQEQFGTLKLTGAYAAKLLTLGAFTGSPEFQEIRALETKRAAASRESYRAETALRRPLHNATTALKHALFREAEGIVQRALIDPPPAWASRLFIGEVIIDESSTPQAVNAVVRVLGNSGIGNQTDRNARVEIDVVLHVTPSGVYGTIARDVQKQEENLYYYDAFRAGTIQDPKTGAPIAHTSLDFRLQQFRLDGVPQATRDTLMKHMRENALLRRQVDQIMNVASRLHRSELYSFSNGTRALLRSYIEYWAYGHELTKSNMVHSSLLIGALKASEANRIRFAEAILTEVQSARATRRPLSPTRVREALAANKASHRKQHDSSSTSSSDDGGDWILYSTLWDNTKRDPCDIQKDDPMVQEIGRETGLTNFSSHDYHQTERVEVRVEGAKPGFFDRLFSPGDGNNSGPDADSGPRGDSDGPGGSNDGDGGDGGDGD